MIVPMHEKIDLDTTRALENYNFKYKEVWQRAKNKLVCSLRVSKFISEIRKSHTVVEHEVKNYLRQRAGLYHRQTLVHFKKLPWGIVHPSHKFRQFWNIYIGFLLLYTATVTPMVIAFFDSVNFDTFFVLDTIIDFCYICDLIINCNTAFLDNDSVLITSRKAIVLNYLKGWMILDIMACVPFGLIPTIISQASGKSYNKLVRLFRLRSIPKLFRFSKVIKIIKTYKTNFLLEQIQIFLNINHSMMRLFATIAGILISLHLVGCFWYMTALFSTNDYDSWIFRYGYEDESTYTLYLTSVYWAITTLTSIGYGDIVPFSDSELIFTIIWIAATMYFLSFTVSSLSTVITMIDIKKQNLDLKLAMVDDFAKEAKISKQTKQKMQKRIRITNERLPLSIDDEEKLMREIPKDLKFEIACNMHDGFLNSCMFFRDRDKEFISSIALFLQPHYFSKNDAVIHTGELATDIYFVLHGSVNFVCDRGNTVFKVYGEGKEFADIEVLLKIKRLFSVVSSCETTLLVMKEGYVRKLREGFPGIWMELKEKAREKLIDLNRTLAEALVLKQLKLENNMESVGPKMYQEMIESELKIVTQSHEKNENSNYNTEISFNTEINEQVEINFKEIKNIKESLEMLKQRLGEILQKGKCN